MKQIDVGEIEEVKLIIGGLRDICLYIENGNIKNVSQGVFNSFAIVLKFTLLVLDEYIKRIGE